VAPRENTLEATLREAVRDLDEIGCKWALVGGIAVSARAEPRATRDVDVAVAVKDDAEAESIVHRFQLLGYRVAGTVEQTAIGRLATARLKTRSGLFLDLLFASSGIEHETVEGAEVLNVIPRLRAPVASVAHLLAMKLLARDDRDRPQDSDDIQHLLAVATSRDVTRAKAALALVEKRGYHRGKKLKAELERVLRALKTRTRR
jgi:predicted nucleotidyltransferase